MRWQGGQQIESFLFSLGITSYQVLRDPFWRFQDLPRCFHWGSVKRVGPDQPGRMSMDKLYIILIPLAYFLRLNLTILHLAACISVHYYDYWFHPHHNFELRRDIICQYDSPSPTESESNWSQNMVTHARNANLCMKCQYVVVLLTVI